MRRNVYRRQLWPPSEARSTFREIMRENDGIGGLIVWLSLVVVATALTAATYGLGLAGVALAWAVFFASKKSPRWFEAAAASVCAVSTYHVLGPDCCIVLTAWFVTIQAHIARTI